MDTILYNEDIQFPEAFPAKHTYENRINSNPFLALHWHKACEIVYVESGSYVCTIGGTRYAASQGDILFVNSCVPHDRIFYSGRYDVMVFDPMRIFMGASGQTTPDAGLQIFTTFPKEDFGLRKYASEFFPVIRNNPPGEEFMITGFLYKLYMIAGEHHFFMADRETQSVSIRKMQKIDPVIEYIKDNYMHPIYVDTLAGIVRMSPRYFSSLFKSVTTMSPLDYVNLFRVNKACGLLTESSVSVTDVAYKCGFNDSSYFSRIFRKYKGVSPIVFRKHNS